LQCAILCALCYDSLAGSEVALLESAYFNNGPVQHSRRDRGPSLSVADVDFDAWAGRDEKDDDVYDEDAAEIQAEQLAARSQRTVRQPPRSGFAGRFLPRSRLIDAYILFRLSTCTQHQSRCLSIDPRARYVYLSSCTVCRNLPKNSASCWFVTGPAERNV
jgi:hypothetical protein